jgi:IS5 family transposase
MYRHSPDQTEFVEFYLPFSGKLQRDNRWVKLAELVPWEEVERHYRGTLSETGMGAPAKSGRIAFGALVIKERLGLTDEETVEQITENPYLQYFLGLHEYRERTLFDSSMMVHFRSRFGQEGFTAINEALVAGAIAPDSDKENSEEQEPKESEKVEEQNKGKLLMDATCTPADITYPTDLKLLNEAREKSEKVMDILYKPLQGKVKKPRTYRRQARKVYLETAKSKRVGAARMRKAIGKQLRYVKRNLKHIDHLLGQGASLQELSRYEYKCLLVIHTLYDQQLEMYDQRKHRVDHRIVSISQPHVRPIIRGKAGRSVEFGAKLSVSCVEGFVHLDRLDWENFNESGDFIGQVEAYRRRYGSYPKSVHADQIYRTRANRAYCKELGIRLSGPALGRPRKVTAENEVELKDLKQQVYADEVARIPIEGKFGNAKRKGTLNRIMAKLVPTSCSVINVGLIVLNLETALRQLLFRLFEEFTFILKATRIILQMPCKVWTSFGREQREQVGIGTQFTCGA